MGTSSEKKGKFNIKNLTVIGKMNLAFAVVMLLFTLYAALDIFVIPRGYDVVMEDYTLPPIYTEAVYTAVPSETPSPEITQIPTDLPETAVPTVLPETDVPTEAPETPYVTGGISENTPTPTPAPTPTPTPVPTPNPHFTSGNPIITEKGYVSENINVQLSEYRRYDTDIYVAEIYIRSPEYFRTAFAQNKFGRNIKENASVIAKRNDAIFAINGDCYGSRSKGYVIRYGKIYRDSSNGKDSLVYMADGSFKIVKEGKVSCKKLLEQGAVHAFTFGPGLLEDGKILVSKSAEVDLHLDSNQRVGIGMIEPLHYIIMVSDGRIPNNAGLSVYEVAEFLKEMGCVSGYNLDGGGSATMIFMGKIINNPTSYGKTINERPVSDIVYFK